MNEFNELENAMLQWFVSKYKNEHLSRQVKSAKFKNRDYTGHGFFVSFEVSPDLERVDYEWPISGPGVKSSEIEHGLGSLMWGKDGFIDCLEIYGFVDLVPEKVTNFEIEDN